MDACRHGYFAGNASRFCHADGSWAKKADYDNCTALVEAEVKAGGAGAAAAAANSDYTEIIYVCGYTLSLVALLIACGMFLYFK